MTNNYRYLITPYYFSNDAVVKSIDFNGNYFNMIHIYMSSYRPSINNYPVNFRSIESLKDYIRNKIIESYSKYTPSFIDISSFSSLSVAKFENSAYNTILTCPNEMNNHSIYDVVRETLFEIGMLKKYPDGVFRTFIMTRNSGFSDRSIMISSNPSETIKMIFDQNLDISYHASYQSFTVNNQQDIDMIKLICGKDTRLDFFSISEIESYRNTFFNSSSIYL